MSHPNPISRRAFIGAGSRHCPRRLQAAASTRPNILFLMADEHRHDAMDCAGNPVIKTGNLDRLASQEVNVTHTYCQGSRCQPSRASIITGRYVHQHGQSWNNINMKPEWPTMMTPLQAAGYETGMVGKAHFSADGAYAAPGSRDFRNTERSQRFRLDWMVEEFDKIIPQPFMAS